MKAIIVLLFLLVACGIKQEVNAQNDNILDNSHYFDDEGGIGYRNLVKVNTFSAITGDLPIYYERVLHKLFALEVGAGVILPFYTPEIPKESSLIDRHLKNPESGYSIWIQPKYYFQGYAPELNYLGVQFRKRHYNQEGATIVHTDYTVNWGIQMKAGKFFVIDYSIGIGVRFKDYSSNDIENEVTAVMPIGLKFGIIF